MIGPPRRMPHPRRPESAPGPCEGRGDERRFWTAYAVSAAGSGVGAGALPLVAVLLVHASEGQVSLLAALGGLTGAAVTVPLGPWIEFHPKRPVMIVADLLRCAALASIPAANPPPWAGSPRMTPRRLP